MRHPYSVLLPVGFAVPRLLPMRAVRSYRTLSLFASLANAGGGRPALCGTFPGVAPAGHYPAPWVHGARTFLVVAHAVAQPSGASYLAGSASRSKSR